jgi:hypothetical protein
LVVALFAAWSVAACSETDGASELSAEPVVISEIHYHDTRPGDTGDFVELTNVGTTPVDVTDWCLKGFGHCFGADTIIAPGNRVVVTTESAEGRLANEGERIELLDAAGRMVDEVDYSTDTPWPAAASGRGMSLHRRVTSGRAADAWVAGLPTPDAPYRPLGGAVLSPVVVSEVMYRATDEDPADEFVELTNRTDTEVDVSGWCLVEMEVCLAPDTTIRSEKTLVIGGEAMPVRLDDGGGTLTLVDAGGAEVDVVAWDDEGDWPAVAGGGGASLQRRDPGYSGLEPGNWSADEPTRGRPNTTVAGPVLPMMSAVHFERSPAPGQPVVVHATPRHGTNPVLHYVVGFGEEVSVPMRPDITGRFTGAVPGQPAGSLVRFRITATRDGTSGSWPREGDGSRYAGTVVTGDEPTDGSELPRLQWFMPDDVYDEARNDLYKRGRDGYPAVLAFDGEVFDGVTIRVKGQNSKVLDKKKWKVALPYGHVWDGSGMFIEPVDEFALHSMATDKAMVNELLSYEVQKLSGGFAQQVVPLRLERNGEFYGLYLYVEQDDGRWRRRHGMSDATIVYEGRWGAQLPLEDLLLESPDWRRRYRRNTHTYVDDTRRELADLIATLDPAKSGRVAYAYRHIDIPSVVEAIATMRVTQHFDWGRKNWVLMYDPEDAKWRLYPLDHDLTFGKVHKWSCGVTCSTVTAISDLDYFQKHALGRLFLESESLGAMIDARTRTLADAFYAPGVIEDHIERWARLFAPLEELDRQLWPTFGQDMSPADARTLVLESFVAPKRAMMISGGTDDLPRTPTAEPSLEVERVDADTVRVTNTGARPVDLSGRSIEGLWGKVPAGVVLNPGQSAVFERERVPAPSLREPADGGFRNLHVWVPSP